MNLTDTQEKLIEVLGAITGIVTVDAFQGDIEDLIIKPKKIPAVYVIWGDCAFPGKNAMGAGGAYTVPKEDEWSCLLFGQNLRGNKEAALGIYPLIEAVLAALTGYQLETDGDLFWPTRVSFIHGKSGTLVYGVSFGLKGSLRKNT